MLNADETVHKKSGAGDGGVIAKATKVPEIDMDAQHPPWLPGLPKAKYRCLVRDDHERDSLKADHGEGV